VLRGIAPVVAQKCGNIGVLCGSGAANCGNNAAIVRQQCGFAANLLRPKPTKEPTKADQKAVKTDQNRPNAASTKQNYQTFWAIGGCG
jgi:hypothetical protein